MEQILRCIDSINAKLNQSVMVKNVRYIRQDLPNAYAVDFDDSCFTPQTTALDFDRADDTLWVRLNIEHQPDILGIPTAGDRLRIMSVFQAPIELYLNGTLIMKEDTWSDFRTPEVVAYDSFDPEGCDVVAVKIKTSKSSFCKGRFFFDLFLEKIDDIRMDLCNMKAELEYLKTIGVSKEEIEKLVQKLAPLYEVEAGTRPGSEIRGILAEARKAGEHLREIAKQNTVYMVGHAHIDMNWLWTMDETKDLIRRDFTTVCNMMEEYPEFHFSQSQCATYDICEKENPELFRRVTEKIKGGQWDVTATSWVENDNNMADGEAAVRQILYSKGYLKEKFGIEPTIMWAPDTFGHSANTPQVLKNGGINSYFFMRCGKKECTVPTYEYGYGRQVSDYPIIQWEGLDGSRVLAANLEYNGEYHPQTLLRNIRDNLKNDIHNILCVYGVGDHGGAPTKRDIRRALEMAKSPLFADVKLSSSKEYFEAVSQEIDKIPVQKGEMNFVFEGCYTTHGDLKRAMRKLEQALLDTEQLALHGVLKGIEYPADALQEGWKTLLFHQFHDIYDGCAIAETYKEALPKLYRHIEGLEKIRLVISKALSEGEGYSVINTTPYRRDILVELPIEKNVTVLDQNNQSCAVQKVTESSYALVKNVSPFSVSPLTVMSGELAQPKPRLKQDEAFYYAENDFYSAKIAKANGTIVAFYDKTSGRWLCHEVIESWRSGRGIMNLFSVYQENPEYMSAWTIGRAKKIDYLTEGAKSYVKEDGELVQIITFRHRYNNSEILQDIIFETNSPVIRFDTKVEWRETGGRNLSTPALRVLFEPQIENTAVYNEVPFGVVARPNKNAEYPNIRFSAVTDERGGFGVLNDSKYGIQCGGNKLEPTLIRSGWDPDPYADICSHHFTYALVAFAGEISQSAIGEYAAVCNGTESLLTGRICSALPIRFDCPRNVFVSAVKLSEDSDDIILRLYEAFGEKTMLDLTENDGKIYEVNSLEEKNTEIADKKVYLMPHEVKTYRLEQ